MKLVFPIRAVLLLTLLVASHAADAPQIFWASDPVEPNETVLVMGDGLNADAVVEFARVEGGSATRRWETVKPLQAGPKSAKAVVPATWKPALYACRVRVGDAVSNELLLNAADPWWWNGDGGESASPGGWLRIFGKALNFGGASRIILQPSTGKEVNLTASESSGYALTFRLPAGLAPGDYAVSVHNGQGGPKAWVSLGTVAVRLPPVWKQEVFNVKDFGADPAEALLAALKKAETNGGGIVYLSRGRYPVKSTLVIPPHTVVRGEAMALVSLYWPDYEKPPAELISGANYGLESLSIYCQMHRHVITDADSSTRFFLHRVRIRANCYFMIEEVGKEFRGRRGPASHEECGAAVLLRGQNFEITDCDIYASNKALWILKGKTGVIARNQFRYGGRGYSIENTERLIFEENQVTGSNLLAIGNDVTSFWTNYCRHIYYARNHVQQMYGADREMMTLDAGGGAYFGKLAAVSGTNLTLAADPVFHDYAPKPHTDWTGAAVQIIEGKGAGQYRLVTANNGRDWQVDRPWLVVPDQTSTISIAPFRGRNLFIDNQFEDGGAFQLYGAGHDTIVAGNKGARMDGFMVWGLNPHGWGYQPSWCCQFLDNEILEGNGYGHRSAGFGTIAFDETKAFAGPLVVSPVFRRNLCHNNAGLFLDGATQDALVEHCKFQDTEVGVRIQPTVSGTLLRDNQFMNVAQPVHDEKAR